MFFKQESNATHAIESSPLAPQDYKVLLGNTDTREGGQYVRSTDLFIEAKQRT